MDTINTSRGIGDIILTRHDFTEALAMIPYQELALSLLPYAELLAKYGLLRTENLAEMAVAHIIRGEVVQHQGYDVVDNTNPVKKRFIEVKTLTSYRNTSSGIDRKEQKVVVRLSKAKERLDVLLLEVVGLCQKTNTVTHVVNYAIPKRALFGREGKFLKAFDVRLDNYGFPVGDCKWTQWSFLDKAETNDRINSIPDYNEPDVDETLFS